MPQIPDETAVDRDFLFWTGDSRAIAIRAADEDDAREQLTSREQRAVTRVTVAGETVVTDEDRQLLGQLGSRPEWNALRRLVEFRMSELATRLAREFLRRDARPDYEQLQWQRGVVAGMKFLLDNPTVEAKKLERLLADERMIESA